MTTENPEIQNTPVEETAPAQGAFRSDIERYYQIHFGTTSPSFAKKLRLVVRDFALHCVILYRFGQFARRLGRRSRLLALPFKLVHAVMYYFARGVHHVDIDDADIGPGLFIGHVGTIYIGPTKIGRCFTVAHNVTIGVGHAKNAEGIPTIGDNVWVGTGSVISGAISIGNGVTITNGCMLSRSVPDGCLVAGNPGRVINREYDNTDLLGLPG